MTYVAGNYIARLNHDNVARDDVLSRDMRALSVANNESGGTG